MNLDQPNPNLSIPVWGPLDTDDQEFSADLVGGGAIDELARAAREHGVMMTLSFIPAVTEDDNKITKREALALGWLTVELDGHPLPDPPELIELWEEALAATADKRNEDPE